MRKTVFRSVLLLFGVCLSGCNKDQTPVQRSDEEFNFKLEKTNPNLKKMKKDLSKPK